MESPSSETTASFVGMERARAARTPALAPGAIAWYPPGYVCGRALVSSLTLRADRTSAACRLATRDGHAASPGVVVSLPAGLGNPPVAVSRGFLVALDVNRPAYIRAAG